MKSAITQGVKIDVETEYVSQKSDPQHNQYFFAYHITITNQGNETLQLLSRHWIITNANGNTEEVEGPGVIGEQPILEPGESFNYTSFCPLTTPLGSMHGTYQMISNRGEKFDAKIPVFRLAMEEMMLH